MGLDDRDYFRERHKESKQSRRQTNRKYLSNRTGIVYLIYPLITIAGLWYGVDSLLGKKNRSEIIPTAVIEINESSHDSPSGGVILKTDSQGHFRGSALINNVPMQFLIDTGATRTSIPVKMARAANLPFGSAVRSNTAGGQVIDRLTQIQSLKIGNVEIRNLDANINEYLDEVLIGMNTLKYFRMTQAGNTLILVANNHKSDHRIPTDTFTPNIPIKKPSNIKKTVTCDENKIYKTIYSDS